MEHDNDSMNNHLVEFDEYLPKKPLFTNNVWVGYHLKFGFVVFDPNIHNLFNTWIYGPEREVTLWVLNQSVRKQFLVIDVTQELLPYLGKVSIETKQKISIFYWEWFEIVSEPTEDYFVQNFDNDERLAIEWSNQKQNEDIMSDEEWYLRNR